MLRIVQVKDLPLCFHVLLSVSHHAGRTSGGWNVPPDSNFRVLDSVMMHQSTYWPWDLSYHTPELYSVGEL